MQQKSAEFILQRITNATEICRVSCSQSIIPRSIFISTMCRNDEDMHVLTVLIKLKCEQQTGKMQHSK
jgi:hypothetical protein